MMKMMMKRNKQCANAIHATEVTTQNISYAAFGSVSGVSGLIIGTCVKITVCGVGSTIVLIGGVGVGLGVAIVVEVKG